MTKYVTPAPGDPMGYSKSRKTLEDRLEYLRPLERGEPYAWILSGGLVTAKDLDRWAYRIREALSIAALPENEKDFPLLAKAQRLYSIEPIHGTNRVQAVVRHTSATEGQVITGHASPTHGLSDQPLGRAVATAGEQTVFTVIDAWKKSQPNNTPMHFPTARLSYNELVMLWKWAQSWQPPLMLMEDDGALTISPIQDEVVEYSWHPRPEDMPQAPEVPKVVPVPPRPY